MKTNELRIGNLILFSEGGIEFIVDTISEKGLNVHNDIESIWIEIETFEPIPLTEEWLLKFGFEIQHNTPFYSMVARKDGFNLKVDITGNLFFSEGYFNVQPKYVHQLQNLYFALTGKELIKK